MTEDVRNTAAVAPFPLRPLIRAVGGAWDHAPEDQNQVLSDAAKAMIESAYRDIDPGSLRDYHAHLLGMGCEGPDTAIKESLTSWRHPIERIKALVYFSACDIRDESKGDAQYVERLARLLRAAPLGKMGLLGFDWFHHPDGRKDVKASEFYVSDDRVLAVAAQHPDIFFAMPSVHPYASDALERLHKVAEAGAKIIKWLPNGQGMDASDPRIDPYYEAVKKLGLTILTHVGEEKAVETFTYQKLGNPLLFRRPLDMGVKIIMAHCGNLGDNEDLDAPGKGRVDNDVLVLRLLSEKQYEGNLFADISALPLFNRLKPVADVLARPDLHHRLINGSDYPLPAINCLFSLKMIHGKGLIDRAAIAPLRQIYNVNPLLFDFVLKRHLRHPKTGDRFPASVYMEHPELPV